MSFDYSYQGGNMFISPDHIPAILEATPRLMEKYKIGEADIQCDTAPHPFWKSPDRKLGENPAILLLSAIAHQHDWQVDWSCNAVGVFTIHLFFVTMHSHDQSAWLEDIAHWIQEGTFVQIMDDNYGLWRLYAHQGKIVRVSPTWEAPSSENHLYSVTYHACGWKDRRHVTLIRARDEEEAWEKLIRYEDEYEGFSDGPPDPDQFNKVEFERNSDHPDIAVLWHQDYD